MAVVRRGRSHAWRVRARGGPFSRVPSKRDIRALAGDETRLDPDTTWCSRAVARRFSSPLGLFATRKPRAQTRGAFFFFFK